ncbi:MAG: c-type cytochrome [Planctomycetes bacterium]|nr:c-type cytochrome [Planctomycetota bacterium]
MRTLSVVLSGTLLMTSLILWSPAADPPQSTSFPDPVNTEVDVTSQALPPLEAARGFRVPEGFSVTVFAAEPDVQNPIAMAWDHRGRLWVAENYTYADRIRKFDLGLRDRVLIFEDTDGNGRFDKRTVFTDDVQMLTSIAVGHGGVWLMTPPQLIFIPDRDGDDRPDGAPVVLLDGFTPSTDNHHTFANGLKWGLDGWLYGRCGASSPGRVGAPGTPDEKRVPLFGGVWRFQPDLASLGGQPQKRTRINPEIFEVLCHGTTNPWGMDWNEHGEAFFINTVNGHLWHVIPGAHFRRPHSEDPNPYVYSTIDTHADHYHWDTGKDWTDSRKVTGEHDRLGGGHAHSGATIYLGHTWPESYRGRLLTLNLHGRRVNVERLEHEGTGYVARHEPDMLQAADRWFRGIDLSYGPDGAVYLLDWSDTGECHEATGVHRTSGRIFRVAFPGDNQAAESARRDLSTLNGRELAELHRHPNEWFARQSRQVLAARWNNPGTAVSVQTEACVRLLELLEQESDVDIQLRALESLYVLAAADQTLLLRLSAHENEHIRATTIRLLTDRWPLDTIMGVPHPLAARASRQADPVYRRLVQLAGTDDSGLVRLTLASVLQRVPVSDRLKLAAPLAARHSDATDHNLPLMIWYGLMPVASSSQPHDLSALAEFAGRCPFPVTRQLIARRLAESIDEQPAAVNLLLSEALKNSSLEETLAGLAQGLAGRHKVKPPASWDAVCHHVEAADDKSLRELARDLSVLFGDGRALDEVQRVALDGKADLASRRAALQTLIDNRAPELRSICEQLLAVRYLNTTAVRGLTVFDDPAIGDKLARSYRSFFPVERPAVIDALVTRASFADALLDQVAAGRIPRTEISVIQARQIHSFGNPRLTQKLHDVWGELRDSPDDKRQLIAQLKTTLTADSLAAANKSDGRAVFAKVCANCHRLYGHGGQIGPDLTGSGRQNLDYVLINLIDPSAAVGADYRMSVIALHDGRVLNGIVASRTDKVLTLQTAKERQSIAVSEIDEIQTSTQSLMPDGLLQPLAEQQVRDLIAYLMSPTQVPLSGEQ